MNIDLMKFCANQYEIRDYLQRPFRCEVGIAATDGCIMVVTPDGQAEAEAHDRVADAIKRYLSQHPADESSLMYHPLSEIDLGAEKPWMFCSGSGEVSICDECDGIGTFEHGAHTYECKECNGSGSGEVEGCYQCNGSGKEIIAVDVDGVGLQRKYLALIGELPEAEIAVRDKESVASFRFRDGFGWLMPYVIRK